MSAVLILTGFTKTVLILVYVRCLVCYGNVVSAIGNVPVARFVVVPGRCVGVGMTVIVSAIIASSVVIVISVRRLILYGSVVKTGNCMPVILCILRPFG